ncbi:MAG TPA: phage tail protein [Allosphingosinicella sp.]|nr:phage tail protein [Allosphingosinicella sp.]
MATLVLSTVGQIVGGPVGGAIGAVIGQQIDGRILAPKARHGPRLGDLTVQTSRYGSQIPRIFGTMRVAGTVVWSTDLQEHRAASGGGKGRPKTVNYSYSASFAVALSGRPVREVRRIWADGKLLRGIAGDWKSEVGGFRLHPGSEDQAVDPLVAAVEGAGQAPAYRGMAYAVFEDLQLADFGNRIPSLSFELVAEEATSIGAIAEELASGALSGEPVLALGGYAASGDSVRSAIAALADVVPLSLADRDGRLRLEAQGSAAAVAVAVEAEGAAAAGAGGPMEVRRRAASGLPVEATVAYHDPARDWQAGVQRAETGEAGLRADRRALPAALDAGAAKGLAEHRLAAAWAERARARVHLPWRRAALRPGLAVRLAGVAGLWRIERWSLEAMVLTLDLAGLPSDGARSSPAEPGRSVAEPDRVHGATSLALLDLPLPAAAEPGGQAQLLVAAAGASPGWRSAALSVSFDGGATWQSAGRTPAPAVMGTLLTAPAAAGAALLDMRHGLEVELLNEAMWLESRSDAALADGANLAAVGDELIQFGIAEPLGDRRFRLSRLLRGRRGTEWATGGQAPGDRFVLIEPAALAPVPVPPAAVNSEVRLLATGLEDGGDGVVAARMFDAAALRPPAPVHLRAARRPDGGLDLAWTRRSRIGWDWIGGTDTPLGEEREAYRVTIWSAGTVRRVAETAVPAFAYPGDLRQADGAAAPIAVEVVQLGTHGASRPARIVIGR